MTKQYLDYIDLAKGIGILLVVIGHGPLNNFAINVFHMPLFFFLAGLTFTPPQITSLNTFVIKKLNRIIIPYIFFSLLSAIMELMIGRLSLNNPFNGPLWFLQTIFCASIIYACFHLLVSRKYLHAICFTIPLIVYIIQKYTTASSVIPFGLVRATMAVFYIHVGWCINNYAKEFAKNKVLIFIWGSILYAIGVFVSIKYFDVNSSSFVNTRAYMYCMPIALLTSIAGIFAVLSFSMIVSKLPFVNWFGKNSLVVVCVHFPLQERINNFCFYLFQKFDLNIPYKLALCVVGYCVTIAFCYLSIQLCKKYIPKLSGYSPLIPL